MAEVRNVPSAEKIINDGGTVCAFRDTIVIAGASLSKVPSLANDQGSCRPGSSWQIVWLHIPFWLLFVTVHALPLHSIAISP